MKKFTAAVRRSVLKKEAAMQSSAVSRDGQGGDAAHCRYDTNWNTVKAT
ncbi:MAG: hypothetical protein II882_00080 [Lachnospiraceae bacterium]|nr:hypothetical protein [Lachnospiraceae bacterium]